jgi:hypothetical protein
VTAAGALDLRPLVARVEESVGRHALAAPGAYRRWTRPPAGARAAPSLDPYGCADAANLLWTIGAFPADGALRAAFVAMLRAQQDPDTGLWREETHHPTHTTAHCVAALELFDARPLHPLRALAPLLEPGAVERFLDDLAWREDPWRASHQGAGAYAALVLAGAADARFEDRYFDWLEGEVDPATGFLRRGCVPALADDAPSVFPHLAGTFHYLFNFEHRGRALPYPEARIDACLELAQRRRFPLAHFVGFAEIDWIYCLARSLRRSSHRRAEAEEAMRALARRHHTFLMGLDPAEDPGWDDLHALFGAFTFFAELDQALPGLLRVDRPLRLVLDRRPFL